MSGDNWETPLDVFQEFGKYAELPSLCCTIWDPFYSTGRSHDYLQETFPEYEIIHENVDFFKTFPDLTHTVIITNPPYSMNQKVIKELVRRDAPFAVFVRCDCIFTGYMQDLFSRYPDHFKVFVPNKRTAFIDPSNGKQIKGTRFLSLWITYKFDHGDTTPVELHLMQ